MPIPLIQDQEDLGYWNRSADQEAPTSAGDAIGASFQLGLDRTLVSGFTNAYAMESLNRIEGQRTLSVEELNDKYRDSGITWTSPKKEAVADFIHRDHVRKNDLHRRIALANTMPGQGIFNFAAEMFAGAPEMVLGGAGVGALMKMGGVMAGASLASRAGFAFTENAISSVPIEAMNLYTDRQLQQDISMTGSIANIAIGGAFGAGIEGVRFGAQKYWPGIKAGASKVKENVLSKMERARAVETAAQQLAEGRNPRISPLVSWVARQRDGAGPRPEGDYSGRTQSQFQDLGESTDVKGTFFNGVEGRQEDMALRPPEEGEFGAVQNGSSDPMSENVRASENRGVIHQFDFEGKLAPVDVPLPEEGRGMVNAFLKERGYTEIDETATLRDVYGSLKPAEKNELNQLLRSQGLQGLRSVEGSAENPRNRVMIFPEDAPNTVRQSATLEHDPRLVGEPTPEEVRQYLEEYHAKENELFHSPELDAKIEERLKRAEEFDPEDQAVVDKVHSEALDSARRLREEGNLDADAQALLDKIEAREKNAKQPKGEKAAPHVEGMPPVPADPGTVYAEQVKRGEAVIKSLYTCIGGTS